MARTHNGEASGVADTRKAVSMADVARVAGVSQQTVSRVVNDMPNVSDKTRERVKAAMDELGFRPSYAGRSLRGGRYRSVGLCVNDVTEVGNLTMLDGVAAAAREHGYAVTLMEVSKGENWSLAGAVRSMSVLPVDGVILGMSRLAPDFEQFVPLAALPCIIVSMYAHPRCTTVDSDQYGCSLMLMDHLLSRGHRKIRYVAGPEYSVDESFRQAGWRDALAGAGLEAVEPLRGDWTADSGYEIACRMLDEDDDFTAVYAANDQMANGVMCALRDRGLRVPQDVSVVGVDDSLADYVPRSELTTVRFDMAARGRTAFDYAVPERPDGPTTAIRIPGTLVERNSVAQARR